MVICSIPFVYVIFPIRKEAGYVEPRLNAILVQNYPANCMEILIAGVISVRPRNNCAKFTSPKLHTISISINYD
jgi:hypothetical protein